MQDIILEGNINAFADSRNLSSRSLADKFEAFAAYSILRKYHQTDLPDIEDGCIVGGPGDGGIDTIAILVNGRPVMTSESIDYFIEKLHRLDVEFIFIQAKTSRRFNSADIGHFGYGVQMFFSEVLNSRSKTSSNPDVQQMVELARYIFRQSAHMQENPRCCLYYVTAGNWKTPEEPTTRIEHVTDTLQNMNVFSEVSVTPIDSDLLKQIYRGIVRAVMVNVEFSKTAVFPRISGVDDAYIGLLPGDEFIGLVSTDDGKLNRDLFYDNVRDFQGNNSVNKEIQQTLSDDLRRNNFPLLNNGITIVARSIKRIGDRFQISDFQIVNGCQTTHIVFENRHQIGADVFVPVKLVATNDSQVVADVVKATNRQTAVLPEALETLTPFHKDLEDYYVARERTVDTSNRIFYERRSKQYAMDKIHQSNIVTLTRQIKAFVGMFLDEPHSHQHYYGELLRLYEGRIFASDHRPDAYYASGVALVYVDKWLNADGSRHYLRPYKYHLLMLIRMLLGNYTTPRLNSIEIGSYALPMVDMVRDPESGEGCVVRAMEIVKEVLGGFGGHSGKRNPPHRLKAFTEELKGKFRPVGRKRGDGMRDADVAASLGGVEKGSIVWYDDWRGYGFIGSDSGGDDVFVHQSSMHKVPWHRRVAGTRVRYGVARNPGRGAPNNMMAVDVELESTNRPSIIKRPIASP